MKHAGCLFLSLSFFALSETAFAGYCSEPSKPWLPSGNSTNIREMEDAQSEIESYLSKARDFVECKQGEIEEIQQEINNAVNEANRLKSDWEDEVNRFNSR